MALAQPTSIVHCYVHICHAPCWRFGESVAVNLPDADKRQQWLVAESRHESIKKQLWVQGAHIANHLADNQVDLISRGWVVAATIQITDWVGDEQWRFENLHRVPRSVIFLHSDTERLTLLGLRVRTAGTTRQAKQWPRHHAEDYRSKTQLDWISTSVPIDRFVSPPDHASFVSPNCSQS